MLAILCIKLSLTPLISYVLCVNYSECSDKSIYEPNPSSHSLSNFIILRFFVFIFYLFST